jgi:hypothetical protein
MPQRTVRLGRVLDGAGAPIPGALVSVVYGTAPTPEVARQTDEAGYFHVGLPLGRFRVAAFAPGGGTGSVDVNGDSVDEIVIRIDAPERLT